MSSSQSIWLAATDTTPSRPANLSSVHGGRNAPELDNNTEAYLLLLEADATGKYAEAKSLFDRSYSIADDPKIRYVADFFSRACQLGINAGVASFGTDSSVEGSIKGFFHGLINPLDSIDAGALLLQKYFGDFGRNSDYADSRYHTRMVNYLHQKKEYERIHSQFLHFSWVIFCAIVFLFVLSEAEPVLEKPVKT